MKLTLNTQDLDNLKDYLPKLKNSYEKNIDPIHSIGYEETMTYFKNVKGLIKYGESINALGDFNYLGFIENNIRDQSYHVIIHHYQQVENLIESYRVAIKEQKKDELFSKQILNMTGYEFAEYLVHLGLVKKNYNSQEEFGVETNM